MRTLSSMLYAHLPENKNTESGESTSTVPSSIIAPVKASAIKPYTVMESFCEKIGKEKSNPRRKSVKCFMIDIGFKSFEPKDLASASFRV